MLGFTIDFRILLDKVTLIGAASSNPTISRSVSPSGCGKGEEPLAFAGTSGYDDRNC